jgi:phage shock protein A
MGLGRCPRETGSAVIELRREAAAAVGRERRIRNELVPLRELAEQIEERARRAWDEGEEILARQILAQGLCALAARDALEADLVSVQRRIRELLVEMVQHENRVWRVRRPLPGTHRGGCGC